jgi:hypothetical protein
MEFFLVAFSPPPDFHVELTTGWDLFFFFENIKTKDDKYEFINTEHSVDIHNQNALTLKSPPKYVIVELTEKLPGAYEGLPPNHVPVYPIKRACVRVMVSKENNLFKGFNFL